MRKVVFLFLLLSLTGCARLTVVNLQGGYQPVLPLDSRPKLEKVSAEEIKGVSEDTKKKLLSNSDKLMLDNLKLRKTIERYNQSAEENNAHVKEALGITPKGANDE